MGGTTEPRFALHLSNYQCSQILKKAAAQSSPGSSRETLIALP